MDILNNLQLLEFWQNAGLLLKIFLAFFAGILTSLTPCVYPLIPITISLFSNDQTISRRSVFYLRLTAYIAGLSFCYSLLGLLTAIGGGIFGQYLGNKYFIYLIVLLLLLMAMQNVDLLRFQIFNRFQNWAGRFRMKTGYLGLFLAGAGSGLIAAPCVGPVLVLILSQAALSQNIFYGSVLLFSFSLGLSLLLILLALFSGLIKKLPAAGSWFYGIKILISTALIVTAIYFLKTLKVSAVDLLLSNIPGYLVFVIAILGVTLLILSMRFSRSNLMMLAALCLAITSANIIWPQAAPIHSSINVSANANKEHDRWETDFTVAKQKALQNGQIILVDLYADWCIACDELDKKVLAQPAVLRDLANIVKVRLDFTIDDDFSAEFSKRYQVLGLPCILFLDSNFEEIPGTRVTGLVSIEEFQQQIKKALEATK